MTPDSISLIRQLRKGNQIAFTSLYDQYSKQLYRNIFRLVKDEDVAKEVLQDLFMKIWEIREDIDPDKSFKSFLYKVAENLVYGHFRNVAKNQRLIDQLIWVSTEFDSNVEDKIITKESHDLLNTAIEILSPQRKRIYTLCKLEGKSYYEVSIELGISTSTIRNQIVKANKVLKQYYLNQDLTLVLLTAQILGRLLFFSDMYFLFGNSLF